MAVGYFALYIGQRAVQKRKTMLALVPFYAGELLDSFSGEAARDILLPFRKDIDGKKFGLVEARIAFDLLIDADQHQGGVE